MDEHSEMRPPPTYNIPVVCLIVGCLFVAIEIHAIVAKGRVQIPALFVAPGALLLGLIGLWDPVIPSSLQPGAQGYPRRAKILANLCWVISILIGGVLYLLLV